MVLYDHKTSSRYMVLLIMCGIFSVISYEQINRNLFEKCVALLSHRGPDHQGIKYFNNSASQHHIDIAFGHQRLAIVDQRAASNQPFTMSDNNLKLHLIFNGEIYNFEELKRLIKSEFGVSFNTNSDTELILVAYALYGVHAFKKFDGVWSIVIYDECQNKVIISRDRL